MAGLTITGYEYSLSVSTNNGSSYGGYGGYTLSSWTSGTSFVIFSLTNGYLYKIKIRAVNSAGQGTESEETAAFKPNTVPGAPTSVQGTSNANGQSSVSWVAPTDNGGSNITSYTVQYSTSATFASAVTTVSPVSSSSPKIVTGLTNGTPYYFRVAATNAGTNGGTGSYSTISAVATPATVPGAPTIGTMTLSTSNTTDSLAWTAPTDNGGSAITGYVYATNDGTTIVEQGTTGNGTTTSKTFDPGYTNITTTVKVAAVNSIGTGPYSSFSAVGYGGWTSTGVVITDATDCPNCGACTCPACDGGCDGCGSRSITGSKSITGTKGYKSKTCYKWTRGAQETGASYNQNSTAACTASYGSCSAGDCGCSAGDCGCSACSATWGGDNYVSSFIYGGNTYTRFPATNSAGNGINEWYYYIDAANDISYLCGCYEHRAYTAQYCSASDSYRAIDTGVCKYYRSTSSCGGGGK